MAKKEYIELESAKKVLEKNYAFNSAELLDEVPKADVQEVVRCKDCKKFCPYLSVYADNCIGAFGHCQITHMNVSPDFYCGYGEKGA